jgi:hypothetical protein
VELSRGSATLPSVRYHFRALHRIGLLEPAGTAPRRGATQHLVVPEGILETLKCVGSEVQAGRNQIIRNAEAEIALD